MEIERAKRRSEAERFRVLRLKGELKAANEELDSMEISIAEKEKALQSALEDVKTLNKKKRALQGVVGKKRKEIDDLQSRISIPKKRGNVPDADGKLSTKDSVVRHHVTKLLNTLKQSTVIGDGSYDLCRARKILMSFLEKRFVKQVVDKDQKIDMALELVKNFTDALGKLRESCTHNRSWKAYQTALSLALPNDVGNNNAYNC